MDAEDSRRQFLQLRGTKGCLRMEHRLRHQKANLPMRYKWQTDMGRLGAPVLGMNWELTSQKQERLPG
jgi:hypothetical protein